jgi:uncharacterized protein YebE (UPF0316 family)
VATTSPLRLILAWAGCSFRGQKHHAREVKQGTKMQELTASLPDFFRSDFFAWVVLPLLIFFSRILDVSIGTVRLILISRGQRHIAPLLGFFEILIWLLVITQVLDNLRNPVGYVAYAGGFATGNLVGMWIENKLALGTLVLRIILAHDATELMSQLHDAGFGVTSLDAHGTSGDVKIIYTVIRRRDLKNVLKITGKAAPKAFISVEEVRRTSNGVFPRSLRYEGKQVPVADAKKQNGHHGLVSGISLPRAFNFHRRARAQYHRRKRK